MLRERYRCPQFRILVIGRALAGKTTILEKVCGVAKGTHPIIYNENGKLSLCISYSYDIQHLLGEQIAPSEMHLTPSIEVRQLMMCGCLNLTNSQRGIHNIEHQITYNGSNFIFHDSPGFEAGSHEEINEVWKFIQRRSNSIELKDQLHAIWYFYIGSLHVQLIRPFTGIAYQWIVHVHFCLQSLSSLIKGQGMVSCNLNDWYVNDTVKVPLVVAFTKFDGQIINEYVNLEDELNNEARWEKARENADKTFQTVYLRKIQNTKYPPKEYVLLQGVNDDYFWVLKNYNCLTDMDIPENTCSELVEKTADIIDDASLHQLLVSTQMNNLDLCVKAAIK